jgi:hypothetical protein
MAWPDSPLTTYVAGSPPWVKANDLNAMQVEPIRLWQAARGGDFLIADEFTGDSLNRSIWTAPTLPVVVGDDSANGAFGVAQCVPNGRGQQLLTQMLPIGTNDFRFSARVRFPFYSAAPNAFARIGLYDTGTSNEVYYFEASFGKPNLRCMTAVDSAYVGPPVPQVAYAHLEIRRASGIATFLVDGVPYLVRNHPNPIVAAQLGLQCDHESAANEGAIYVDHIKLWIARYPAPSFS